MRESGKQTQEQQPHFSEQVRYLQEKYHASVKLLEFAGMDKLLSRLICNRQMSIVNGIKGASHNADSSHEDPPFYACLSCLSIAAGKSCSGRLSGQDDLRILFVRLVEVITTSDRKKSDPGNVLQTRKQRRRF